MKSQTIDSMLILYNLIETFTGINSKPIKVLFFQQPCYPGHTGSVVYTGITGLEVAIHPG